MSDYLLDELLDGDSLNITSVMVIQEHSSPVNNGKRKTFFITAPKMDDYFDQNIWIHSLDTAKQWPTNTLTKYHYVEAIKTKKYRNGNYVYEARLISNGNLPSSILISYRSSHDNIVDIRCTMYDFYDRVGPESMTFDMQRPHNSYSQSVVCSGSIITCDDQFHERYNFYGEEFFRDEIDKIRYLTTKKLTLGKDDALGTFPT